MGIWGLYVLQGPIALIGLPLIVWGIAWGIIEFRRYLRRADETVEADLIAETNKAFEEWVDSDPDRVERIAWRRAYKQMVEDKR
jgi:hypothetical protein